jgi:cellulose synthase operon protein C
LRRRGGRRPGWGLLAAFLLGLPGSGGAEPPPPSDPPSPAEFLALGMPLAARTAVAPLSPAARGRFPALPSLLRDLAAAGFPDDALSLFETVRPDLEEPVRSEAWFAAGQILWEKGERRAADRAFREVSRRSGAAPEAMLYIGRHLASEGKVSEAVRALAAEGGDRAALYAGLAEMSRNNPAGALAAWSEARGRTPAGFMAQLLARSTGNLTDENARWLLEVARSPEAGFPEKAASLEALASARLGSGDAAGALAAAREGISIAALWKAAAVPARWDATGAGAREVWRELSARYPHGEQAGPFFRAGRRFLARSALAEGTRTLGDRARELARRSRRAEDRLARARDDLAPAIRRAEQIRQSFRRAGEMAAGVRGRLKQGADDLALSRWGAGTDPVNAVLLEELDDGIRSLRERLSMLIPAYDAKIKGEWSPPLPPKDRLTILLAQLRLDRVRRDLPALEAKVPFVRAKVWNRWKAAYATRLSTLLARAESAVPAAREGAERAERLASRLRGDHPAAEMGIARLRDMRERLNRQEALLAERRAAALAAAERELGSAVRELRAAVSRRERRLRHLAARAATELLIAGRESSRDHGAPPPADRSALREEALKHWEASLPPAGEGGPSADEALYAMAELRYEQEEYRFYEAREADGTFPDFSPALELFRSVPERFPRSPYAAPALYGAAICLQEMGREDDSAAVLETLVARHPGARHAAEAHLRLGEHAFEKRAFRRAEEHYRKAADNAPADLRATARFKLGWALYLRERPEEAAGEFLSALLLSPGARGAEGVGRESLEMLARSLVDAGTESGAESFLARRGAYDHGPAALREIQAVLDAQNRYAEAALMADRFGRAYPLDPGRVEVETAAAEALRKGNRVEESLRRSRDFHRIFGPGTAWQGAPGRSAAEIERANRASEEGLRSAALAFHARSRDSSPESRVEALAGYDAFLALFSSSADAGEVAYRRAWLLFEDGKKPEAARSFEAAAGRYGGPRAEAARYMAVQSAKDAAVPSDPDSQAEVVRLAGEYERDFPHGERLPPVLLDRARAHFNRGEYGEAAAAAERAAETLPFGEGRLSALRLAGDALFALEDFAGAETRFRSVLADAPGAELSDEMRTWVGFSMFRRAEGMAGEPAAELFGRVAREFPSLEIAPVALFRSGTAFAGAGNAREAIPAFLSVEADSRDAPLALESTRWLARLYESAGDRVAAAERYERLASLEPGGEEKRALLLRAAELFSETASPRARRGFLAVAALPDTPPAVRIATLFRAAETAREEGKGDEADRLYGEAVKAHRAAPDAAPETAARAYFQRGERRFSRYLRLPVAPPFDRSLAAKRRALEDAAAFYSEAVRIGDDDTAAASLHRMGEGFEELRTALLSSPPPRGLTEAEREAYAFLLEERAAPVEEKAVEAYLENVRRAVLLDRFSRWTANSLVRLRALRPAPTAELETRLGILQTEPGNREEVLKWLEGLGRSAP